MWLARPQSKKGYEMSVSQIEPILANAGKDCYSRYDGPCFKQGRCKWCGKEGMCCFQNSKDESNGCDGTFGGKTQHECVLKPGNLFLTIM